MFKVTKKEIGTEYLGTYNIANMRRKLLLLFFYCSFLLCATITADAQPRFITHIGTQAIGRNTITVNAVNPAVNNITCNVPEVGPYYIGGQAYGTGSYTFTFSKPVLNVRVYTGFLSWCGWALSMTDRDMVSFSVNGAPYPLSSANVAQLSNINPCFTYMADVAGNSIYSRSPSNWMESSAEVSIPGALSITIACDDKCNGIGFGISYEDVIASSNSPICWRDTLKLYCTPDVAGCTYSWTGPAGFTSNLRNPVVPNAQAVNGGDYIVQVVSAGRDTILDTTHVVMMPSIAAGFSFTTPVCTGNILSLLADPSSLSGIKYKWSGPQNFNDTGVSTSIRNIQTFHSGRYRLTVTIGSCTSSIDTFIAVAPSFSSSATKIICSNDWYDLNGTLLNREGTYYDTLKTVNGCDSSFILDLVVLPAPEVEIVSKDTICKDGSAVLLTANGYNGAERYTWHSENGTVIGSGQDVSVYITGREKHFSVIATAGNDCSDTAGKTIYVSDFQISLNVSSAEVDGGTSVTLLSEGNDAYAVAAWYPLELFGDQEAVSQVINADTTRRYIVVARSGVGCIDSASVLVSVRPRIFIPSAFTPNGDGLNDYFHPVIKGGGTVNAFYIYNRWGEVVFKATGSDAVKGWDGTYEGGPAEIGTYFYTIDIGTLAGDKMPGKGEVTLIR